MFTVNPDCIDLARAQSSMMIGDGEDKSVTAGNLDAQVASQVSGIEYLPRVVRLDYPASGSFSNF